MDQRSISSVDSCWLDLRMLEGIVRWGMLKNASWLKNREGVHSFCGGIEE